VEGDDICQDLEEWGWRVGSGRRVHRLYSENSKENTTARNAKKKKNSDM